MLDRFDTNRPRAMADAITKPSAILLAGAGVSAAVLAGAPIVGALVIGAAAWAARVAWAMPKKARAPRIDHRRLRPPWRGFVRDAIEAQARFERVVEGVRPGPLRDRLGEVGARIAEGVQSCWVIAQRGNELGRAVRDLHIDGIRRDLAAAEAEHAHRPRPEVEATVRSLGDQLRSAERLDAVATGAQDRLVRLNAQLDEAVARAVELSLQVDVSGVAPLGTDVDALVTELESLRQALEETSGSTGGTATA